MTRLLLACCLLWAPLALAFDHAAWDTLLKRYVIPIRNGFATQVDYAGITRDRDRLKAYLDHLASVSQETFDRWDRSQRLAFLINAYNAWTVELILSAWPEVKSIKDLGALFSSPWQKSFIPLLGKTRSLDEIEHGLIRAKGAYDEPRIHFAVNCASIGCPALRPEAYTATHLDAQLADATRRFLSDRTRNRLDGNELRISSLFKWYREDFGGSNGLRHFLASHGQAMGLTAAQRGALQAGHLDIAYLDYDWALNRLPAGAPGQP